MVAHLLLLHQWLWSNIIAVLSLSLIDMVKPILDMDAVGAAHPKWECSRFNEGTNYAYQKINMVAHP